MQRRPDIQCPNCAKMFHPDRPSKKFCCRACGIQYNKEHGLYKKTEEQKKKISEARMGKEPWNKGRKCTEEECKKMSEVSKEFWNREGFREKMSAIQKESWSEEELLKKHHDIMVQSHASREVRAKTRDSVLKYYDSVDPNLLAERYGKQIDTKAKNGTLYISNGEKEISSYITSLGFTPKKYVIGKGETRFEIDCYIEELKIGFEYNGIYYHSVNGMNHKSERYHHIKSKIAEESGIQLVHIWEDQWKNQQIIIKDIIRTRLGIKSSNIIYGRDTVIKEIDPTSYKSFCQANHIQGSRPAKIKLGLFYKDELVQVASFGAMSSIYQGNDDYEYEWIRSCTKLDTTVIGGVSKLFKYFLDTYNPRSILCYADWNLFSGEGYAKLGFKLLGHTKSNLFYIVNSSSLERLNRNPYNNNEEKQLVESNRVYKCYGCGSKKFIWYKD